MFPHRHLGLLRLHFFVQQAVLFVLVGIVFDSTAALFCLGAALVEFISRRSANQLPVRLDQAHLSGLSYRQCLFLLATLVCLMIAQGAARLPVTSHLVLLPVSCLWVFASNQYGYSALNRYLYASAEKGLANALLIGPTSAIQRFSEVRTPLLPPGTRVMGYVGLDGASPVPFPGIPRLGEMGDLRTICRQREARALVLLDLLGHPELVPTLRDITNELGIRTMWIDDVKGRFGAGSQAYSAQNFAVVSHLREPLEDPLNRAIKRAFDLFCSTLGIVLVLPPAIALVATLHAFHSPGPLFYRQERSGRNRETFRIFKFRSMYHAQNDGFLQAARSDPRIFRGGGFLRKFSIDELPQLLNVFLGQMSIVGPRPHPVSLDDHLTTKNREYRLRNLAKPGITGLAQCRGWRGETRDPRQIRNRIRMDLFYIRNWSLWLDLRIIVETAAQVIKPPRSAF